jgi:CPA1 family monovalent cation:H+ antiporter
MPDIGLVLGLLAVVAFLAAIGRRVGLPGPIVFAIGGLALALVPTPPIALRPSLVLVVFLPPLIFAAAQDTSWAEMRREAWPILLLAVGLVLVTMSAVAVVAHALAPELTWAAAFTLGAIVAPPDTVAAKAIADTLHLPRRLVAILGGEGLVNDATALVAFQVASGAALGGTAFVTALQVYAPAAVAIGTRWLDRPPHLWFCPSARLPRRPSRSALAVLALASISAGVSLSSTSRLRDGCCGDDRLLLTGLSFVLVGLQPVVRGGALNIRRVLLITAAVCLRWPGCGQDLTLGTVYGHARRARADAGRPRDPRYSAGPECAASSRSRWPLAAGHRLRQAFPGRDLIVFIAFAVILVTLIGQGLTLPALISRLGVAGVTGRGEDQEIAAQVRMARAALGQIEVLAAETGSSPEAVDRVSSYYAGRIEDLEHQRQIGDASKSAQADNARLRAATHYLLDRLMDVERAELQRMRNSGIVDGLLARRLQRGLDLLRRDRI